MSASASNHMFMSNVALPALDLVWSGSTFDCIWSPRSSVKQQAAAKPKQHAQQEAKPAPAGSGDAGDSAEDAGDSEDEQQDYERRARTR